MEAPLEDIAKSAGVGPGTLYRHFPTRSDLIAAAVEDHVEELRRAVDRLNTPSYDASDVLRDWVRLLSDYSGAYGGLADSVLAASSRGGSLGEICRELEDLTEAVLKRASAPQDAYGTTSSARTFSFSRTRSRGRTATIPREFARTTVSKS